LLQHTWVYGRWKEWPCDTSSHRYSHHTLWWAKYGKTSEQFLVLCDVTAQCWFEQGPTISGGIEWSNVVTCILRIAWKSKEYWSVRTQEKNSNVAIIL
jgi:hypothetical protein